MAKKKVLALLLTTAMAASLLSGCGGGNSDSSDDSSSETTESTESTDSEDSSEDSGSSDGEEVVLQVFDAHAYGLDEYAEMVEAFEEEHPGVTIEVQHAANDSNTLLQSRVNSGISRMYSMWSPERLLRGIMNMPMIGLMIRM